MVWFDIHITYCFFYFINICFVQSSTIKPNGRFKFHCIDCHQRKQWLDSLDRWCSLGWLVDTNNQVLSVNKMIATKCNLLFVIYWLLFEQMNTARYHWLLNVTIIFLSQLPVVRGCSCFFFEARQWWYSMQTVFYISVSVVVILLNKQLVAVATNDKRLLYTLYCISNCFIFFVLCR